MSFSAQMIEEGKFLEKKDPLIGECIRERFLIEKRLDEGGFGAVYLALDLQLLGRKVVIKVLLDTLMGDSEARRKFDHEKEALARLDHPGIVNILGAGTLHDGKPYLVLPFVEGKTLKDIIAENGALPFSFCAKVIENLTDALSSAHSKGILHRDVKPSNIILTEQRDGTVRTRLIDFGIARVNDSKISPVTQVEKVQGTLWYMSPEQLQGKIEQGPAVDIFSCSAVFYEMLTGSLPFNPQSIYEMCQLHQEGVKHSLTELRPNIPIEVNQLILKGLSFVPGERPTDICEFGKSVASSLFASAGKTDHELGEHLLLTVKVQNLDLASNEDDNKFTDNFISKEVLYNVNSSYTKPEDSVNIDVKNNISVKQAEVTYILPKTKELENGSNEAFSNNLLESYNGIEQEQSSNKFRPSKVFIWAGVATWLFSIVLISSIVVIFFWDTVFKVNEVVVSESQPPQIINSEIPKSAPLETEPKLNEIPTVLSYYFSVSKLDGKKYQDPLRRTAEGIFFKKGDKAQIVVESAFNGHLYLFTETEINNTLKRFFIPPLDGIYSDGSSFVKANEASSFASITFEGGTSVDKFYLIWTAEKNEELENFLESAIKNSGELSDENAIADLQNFLQQHSNEKVEVENDNNQKVKLKQSGNVLVHLIELKNQ